MGRASGQLQIQLHRLAQFHLQIVDLPLEAGDIVVHVLHSGPLAALDKFLDLQFDAQRVVGSPRVGHTSWCTRVDHEACCLSWI
jgi:hypothetical protein